MKTEADLLRIALQMAQAAMLGARPLVNFALLQMARPPFTTRALKAHYSAQILQQAIEAAEIMLGPMLPPSQAHTIWTSP